MMHRLRSCRALLLGLALLTLPAPLAAATPGPLPRPTAIPAPGIPAPGVPAPGVPAPGVPTASEVDAHCTADGATCITRANYTADVCRTIEAAARDNALDQNFFARLLWQESLFDAAAVSPAGAQGIAQFMPGTAKLRGLRDAFNPAEALYASAAYLAELAQAYGNIGLAAAAYNSGEARLARFVAAKDALPAETRAYVDAITGVPAETWRDKPPATVDLSLDKAAPFQTACVAYAAQTRGRTLRSTPPVQPWGVVLASNRGRDGLERQVARLQNRHAAILDGEPVSYTRARRTGLALQIAQLGRATRPAAEALCARLRSDGGDCMVLRN